MKQNRVHTPLGSGKIVHNLPNGQIVVEFPHGGGHIFMPDEVLNPLAERVRYDRADEYRYPDRKN